MTTFEKVGRWLVAGGVAGLVAAAIVWLVVGEAGFAVALSIALAVGANLLFQGAVWLVLQRRFFGSPAALARAAERGRPAVATIRDVRTTSSSIGADPIPVLHLDVDGKPVQRRVRVPAIWLADVRPGARLIVRFDPAGSRAMIVDWNQSFPSDRPSRGYPQPR